MLCGPPTLLPDCFADFVLAPPPGQAADPVAVRGRVQVERGLGIPDRAAKRGAAPYVVVLPVTKEELKAELKRPPEERSADFFWAVER